MTRLMHLSPALAFGSWLGGRFPLPHGEELPASPRDFPNGFLQYQSEAGAPVAGSRSFNSVLALRITVPPLPASNNGVRRTEAMDWALELYSLLNRPNRVGPVLPVVDAALQPARFRPFRVIRTFPNVEPFHVPGSASRYAVVEFNALFEWSDE